MKILLLASQHGNEPLGEMLFNHISKRYPHLLPHLELTIGNPKAKAAGKRYLESDMNRSYDPALTTYEARRAQKVIDQINQHTYDIVLDLHTTVCVQPPCLIVSEITDVNRQFLKACTIDRIVRIRHPIVGTSLIGVLPDTVSMEVANNDVTPELLNLLACSIERFINRQTTTESVREYVIDELLMKASISEADASRLRNFEMSPHGFIPILVGNNSYKKNTDYLGLKATEETIITL